METACLLGDLSLVDQREIREKAIRIPEVAIQFKKIQQVLDNYAQSQVDLLSCLHFEDAYFVKLGLVRELIWMAIHLGLYNRYVVRQRIPRVLIGKKGSSEVLRVFLGQISLQEFIRPLVLGQNTLFVEKVIPIGEGHKEFEVFKHLESSNSFEPVNTSAQNGDELVSFLVEQIGVNRIVNLGIGEAQITTHNVDPMYERLQVADSILMDPMLTWFNSKQFETVA